MKLQELNKTNIMIASEYISDKNGYSYTLSFNTNVVFNYVDYKEKILVNRNTLEKCKYDGVYVMGAKNKIYLFPVGFTNIYNPNAEYELSEWVFEDSVEYLDIKKTEDSMKLEKRIDKIEKALSHISNYIVRDEETKGLEAVMRGYITDNTALKHILRDQLAEYTTEEPVITYNTTTTNPKKSKEQTSGLNIVSQW